MALLIFLTSVAFIVFRIAIKRTFSYWSRLGVHQLQPSFPFGDFGCLMGRNKLSAAEFYRKLYERTKEHPYVGVYFFFKPFLLVNDLQLINRIMIEDFHHFNGRGVYYDERRDPLSAHLIALSGEGWRQLRSKLGPVFTPAKLKQIFPTQLATALKLQRYLDQFANSDRTVEARDLFSRYANDSIASVAFGVEADSINDPTERFLLMAKKIFQSKLDNLLRWIACFFFPSLLRFFRARVFSQEVADFMLDVVRQTVLYREKNNVSRRDIMQLLVQLRNSGSVPNNDSWTVNLATNVKYLSLEEVTATAFTFFIAGYETTSSVMNFCIYELAKNQAVQQKVQQEIDATLRKTNGEFTYDGLTAMKYLEACIDETLRKFPPLSFLGRACSKDYPLEGTNLVIEKDTMVLIPTFGIHRDEQFYPNPNEFLPERFINGEAVGTPHLAFGDGPRQCIGAKMGKLKAMIGLAALLVKYDFSLADPRQRLEEPMIDPKCFSNHILGGVPLTVKKRIGPYELK